MLDAGYWMLDIQQYSDAEIQKHRVSSNQDQPGLPSVFITRLWLGYNYLCTKGFICEIEPDCCEIVKTTTALK